MMTPHPPGDGKRSATLSRRPRPALTRRLVALTALICAALTLFAVGCSGQSQAMVKAAAADKAGDLPSAVSLYREQLKAHPDDLAALKGLAGDLYICSLWDEALPVQEKVVQLDRKDAQVRIELGFNYLNHQQAPEKAIVVMAEATSIEPSAKYLSFLGQAQAAAGNLLDAEQTLRRAIQADKTYAHSYTVLAQVLQREGKASEATAVLQDAASAGVQVSSTSNAK
jgi:tetratricopeptide (TPR) repeat protein